MTTLEQAFETLLTHDASPDHKKEATLQIKQAYKSDVFLPLQLLLSFSKKIKSVSLLSFFSDLLDHYAPSYPHVSPETRDLSWSFFDQLSDAEKATDAAFFDSLWKEISSQGHALTSPLGEVLAFSRIKHSGWFTEKGFFNGISDFEKTYGALPIEQVLDYESEEDQCFPDLFVLRWLMANIVLSGQEKTAKLLSVACEKTNTDLAFDLENFWINHHEKVKEWFQKPFGQVAVESAQLFAQQS